jgi:threonine aldolase
MRPAEKKRETRDADDPPPTPGFIDLRSDTITLPTPEMREAMRSSKLGDDVFHDDPTVNELEEKAAKRVGKEAAVLVTSGTQGNIVSVLSQSKPGGMAIIEAEAHVYHYEAGSICALAGVYPKLVPGDRGVLSPEAVEAAIPPPDAHFPQPMLLCIENTHNRASGSVTTVERTRALANAGHAHGLKVHLDGARIFNASVALGCDVRDLTRDADTVTFCLSKGLSAPIGSLVCGTRQLVDEARRHRKRLGGAMRQAGIIAAPGLIALEKMVARLAEDHATAKTIGQGAAKIGGLGIDPAHVESNIVIFSVGRPGGIADAPKALTSQALQKALHDRKVRALSIDPRRMRMVTNRHVTRQDADEVVGRLEDAVRSLS